MNAPSPDGPPAESPLDVERVEWTPASPETVRVLVVGRWRSATPVVAPVLIVFDGERADFPAEEHGVVEGAGRVRLEAVEERDAAREDSERRVGSLRARLRSADLHAAELAREMDAVRREGAEAQQAAVAARLAAERAEAAAGEREAELAARLAALGAEAGDVGERLAAERAAREAAEAALAGE